MFSLKCYHLFEAEEKENFFFFSFACVHQQDIWQ